MIGSTSIIPGDFFPKQGELDGEIMGFGNRRKGIDYWPKLDKLNHNYNNSNGYVPIRYHCNLFISQEKDGKKKTSVLRQGQKLTNGILTYISKAPA